MKVFLAQLNPIVGDLAHNRDKIVAHIDRARREGANLVLFPEMALLGYPPKDLLLLPSFVEAVEKELAAVVEASKGITVVVGTVRKNSSSGEKGLFNTAAVIEDGRLVGFQDKTLLPDYDVFSERRYFEPAQELKLWPLCGKRCAITVCEDIWQHARAVEYASYPVDPVEQLKKQKPDLLVNLSASPFYMGRHKTRLEVGKKAAKTLGCPVFVCNQVGGNDSLIFDGYSYAVDAQGELMALAKGFEEDALVPEGSATPISLDPIFDLHSALKLGVRDYFQKLGFEKACIGLSGGIDSAVAACIAVDALGNENVLGVSLPSRYTSPGSCADARRLAGQLCIPFQEISIEKPFEAFLDLLTPSFKGLPQDHTEENLQARIRGTILMAFSNKFGYLLLSTGNKSEMAMGYATLYGDMCGGLGVLSDVSKALVYTLARWINREREIIPLSTLERAPSAELRADQKDSDTLPPYEIVDAVLGHYVEEHRSPEEIADAQHLELDLVRSLVRKIHESEYKRQQAPPGLRVTKRAFAVGRLFPIVQHWNVLHGK